MTVWSVAWGPTLPYQIIAALPHNQQVKPRAISGDFLQEIFMVAYTNLIVKQFEVKLILE